MMTTLHDMFVLGVPVAEKVLRPIVVYTFLIVGLRLAGKRELAQLNPFDLVVLLTISNTVQNAIIGDDVSVSGGLISAATLLVVNHFVVAYLYSHESLDQLIEGSPDVLIENGRVLTDRLKREFDHPAGARGGRAPAGVRLAHRARSRGSRAWWKHLLLRPEADTRRRSARGSAGASRRDSGAARTVDMTPDSGLPTTINAELAEPQSCSIPQVWLDPPSLCDLCGFCVVRRPPRNVLIF